MFNGVGHITEVTFDLRRMQSAIQQFARWADKRQTSPIFYVPGLFADEQDTGLDSTSSEDGLGRSLPQRTTPAVLGKPLCLFQIRKGG